MGNLSNAGSLKNILSENQFKFSKSLGQNFIINPSVCPKMARACGEDVNYDGVLEVGPGAGALTECLAEKFKKVVAVEIDKRLIPILSRNLSGFENVNIINADILKTNVNNLIQNELKDCAKVGLCANLPYYITSEIIMYMLENEFNIDCMVLMLQKEAAQRICALPGTRNCGAISIAIRYYAVPEILFHVKKGSFMPMPSVDSCVIKIKKNNLFAKTVKDKKTFFKIVRAAYSQRRKTLLNSLSTSPEFSKTYIESVLEKAEISPNCRAENLKPEDFAKISNIICNV